jgi:uncharacterized protein (DUF305 family)
VTADDPASGDGPGSSRVLPPWWAVALVALALVGVAFALGRFTSFGAAPSAPGTDSPEAGFARDMQVHHAQAVEMAMTIHRTTADDEIRTLAYDIATTQSAQRGEFFDWLVRWGLPQRGGAPMAWMTHAPDGGHVHGGAAGDAPTDDDVRAAMGMATDAELTRLREATGTEADCLFLALMIRHHEGAVPMADALAGSGTDPRAVQVAEAIAATQSAEIDLMAAAARRLSCGG